MARTSLNKFLLLVGFLSLLHAAYSAAQRKSSNNQIELGKSIDAFVSVNLDRSYLRMTDQENTTTFLPLDVSLATPNQRIAGK